MKNIEILGPGCPRCKQLAENAEKAVAELGLNAHVEKVSDMKRILARGVISTPASRWTGSSRARAGSIPLKTSRRC